MSRFSKPAYYIPLALFCCLLWGSAFPGVKLSYSLGNIEGYASQILLAGCRFTLGGLLTMGLALCLRQPLLPVTRKAIGASCAFGLLQTTLHYILFYIALSKLTGSLGSLINASSALFTVLLAFLLPPHERLRPKQIFGLVLGFSGILLINLKGLDLSAGQLTGAVLMLCAAFVQGLSNLVLKRISPLGPPFQITAIQLTAGGLVLILIGTLLGGTMQLSPAFVLLLIYLALVTAVAFSVWTMLLRVNPVGLIASFMFTIPIFGSILSAIFLGESILSPVNLIAMLLVCLSVYLVNHVKTVSDSKD